MTDYITVQPIDGGYRILAWRHNEKTACQVCMTPHEAVAHGIKRDLDAVIERAVRDALGERADLEAVIKQAVKDALAVRQLELLWYEPSQSTRKRAGYANQNHRSARTIAQIPVPPRT